MRTTYKFTGETKEAYGVSLHRIQALPGNRFVKAGTLGGWIEREENLLDGAWVADEACVYGDAVVYGNTLIEDKARVYGDARVHGDTDKVCRMSMDRYVYGGDWEEEPMYGFSYYWSIHPTSPDTLRIGCRDYSYQKWKKKFSAIIRTYRLEMISEEEVKKCIMSYNYICRKYSKDEYCVDPDEVLKVWRKEHISGEVTLAMGAATLFLT